MVSAVDGPAPKLTVSNIRAQLTGGRRVTRPGALAVLGGGLLAVVGSLLPWVITPVGSLPGLSGAGVWTLSAGFVAIAGAVMPYPRVALVHVLCAGAVLACLSVWQLTRLAALSAQTDSWGSLLPGIGLVMVTGAAVILLRGGYSMVRTPSNGTP